MGGAAGGEGPAFDATTYLDINGNLYIFSNGNGATNVTAFLHFSEKMMHNVSLVNTDDNRIIDYFNGKVTGFYNEYDTECYYIYEYKTLNSSTLDNSSININPFPEQPDNAMKRFIDPPNLKVRLR